MPLTDEQAVEAAARELVEEYGADALAILDERAKNADDLYDGLAAKAWRDIAAAAERLLSERDRQSGQG